MSEFGGWYVADFAVQAALVEPVDVGVGGKLNVFCLASGSLAADEFGLVEASD